MDAPCFNFFKSPGRKAAERASLEAKWQQQLKAAQRHVQAFQAELDTSAMLKEQSELAQQQAQVQLQESLQQVRALQAKVNGRRKTPVCAQCYTFVGKVARDYDAEDLEAHWKAQLEAVERHVKTSQMDLDDVMKLQAIEDQKTAQVQLEESVQRLDAEERKRRDVEQKLASVQARLEEFEKERDAEVAKRLASAQARLEESEKERDAEAARRQDVEIKFASAVVQVGKVEADLADARHELGIEAANARAQRMQSQLDAEKERDAELARREVESKLASAEAQLGRYEADLANLAGAKAELHSEKASAQSKLDAETEKHREVHTHWQAQLDAAYRHVQTLQGELENEAKLKVQFAEAHRQAQARLEESGKERDTEVATRQDVEVKLAAAHAQLAESESRQTAEVAQRQDVEVKLAGVEAQLGKAEADLAAAKHKLDNGMASAKTASTEFKFDAGIAAVQQELAAERQQKAEVQDRVKALEEEQDRLQEELAQSNLKRRNSITALEDVTKKLDTVGSSWTPWTEITNIKQEVEESLRSEGVKRSGDPDIKE